MGSELTALDGAARLHPALRDVATARTDFSRAAIQTMREPFNQRRREAIELADAQGDDLGVAVSEFAVTGPSGDVPVRVYRGAPGRAPAVLYCHAGGFAIGNLDTDHRQCQQLAARARCVVVSVDYRLAPEHPYPAALEDATAVLGWLAASADELGVDTTRVALAGSSAGGALAACLAHAHIDWDAGNIVFQVLHQPVLDDRATGSKTEFRTSPGFDGEGADLMWGYYLAGSAPDTAVPARRARLEGLPDALITCAEIDPFRDEAIDYARRLLAAGVSTQLHVFPRACHGFDSLAPKWSLSQQLFELQGDALSSAFYGT